MPNNLWTAPQGPLMPGTSVASTTFTSAQGLAVGETTTATPVIYGGSLQVGTYITVEAWGVASNTGTPTLALGVYYGGTVSAAVGGTTLKVSAAKTTTTAMTNWPWWVWYQGRVTAVGTSGAIMGYGRWRLPTSATAWTEFNLDENAPASVTIDTTVNKNIVVGATWGTSNASNSITCHGCLVRLDG
jgi:hypothetical protein